MIRERAYSSSGGSRFLKFIAAALSGAFPTFAIAQQLQNATAADGSILPFRQCRRLNGSAEGIRQTEANIIEQDNDDIGRVFRQMTRLSAAYICAANSILEIDQDQRGFLARRASSARRNTDMAFGTIMVNVDFDEDSQDRIHIAVGIANRFGSFLIGVAGWSLRKHDDTRLAGMDYTTENPQKKILERLEQLKATFQRIAGANPRGTEWRSSTSFPNEFISAQARAADLLVIGQALLPGDEFHTYDPGTVILAAGRPVLIIPRRMHHFQPSNVLIAWKDTREARRAVRDALPFLKQAQRVCIAMANPGDSQRAEAQIADVVQYLEHHGITVSRQIATVADESEGNVLGELARKHDSNLIVAGAYGRTRLSEWIFGGVTRHLLLTSPVPCLFSN